MNLRIPNDLLNMGLTPNELKVYCYLMACASNGTAIVRSVRIAERCQMARGTVVSALAGLQNKGMIQTENRYVNGHYAANLYKLANLGGRYFVLPLAQGTLALAGSTFATYLALLKHRGKNGKAFPSLSRLADLLALCRNTIIKAIKQLLTLGLVCKAPIRPGRHNLYLLFAASPQKRKELPVAPESPKNKSASQNTFCCKLRIALSRLFVKIQSVFSSKVVHFLDNKTLPHPTT